jgi:hypothetical protein
VRVIVDPDSKAGQITAAAKVLGTVTEVAAFTERKEVRTISSSEDARARVMQELRGILTAQAQDATIIEADADSLMRELAVNINAAAEGNAEPSAETPPHPDPPDDAAGVPRP